MFLLLVLEEVIEWARQSDLVNTLTQRLHPMENHINVQSQPGTEGITS